MFATKKNFVKKMWVSKNKGWPNKTYAQTFSKNIGKKKIGPKNNWANILFAQNIFVW